MVILCSFAYLPFFFYLITTFLFASSVQLRHPEGSLEDAFLTVPYLYDGILGGSTAFAGLTLLYCNFRYITLQKIVFLFVFDT